MHLCATIFGNMDLAPASSPDTSFIEIKNTSSTSRFFNSSNAKLVEKALYSIKYDLRKIDLFHSDYAEEKTIPKFWIRKMKIA